VQSGWVVEGPELETLEVLLAGLVPGAHGYSLPGTSEVEPSLFLPRSGADAKVAAGAVVVLHDLQNTPLAELHVAEADATEGGWWVSGEPYALRPPGHGPARGARLSRGVNLRGGAVGLFTWPVDLPGLLRLARTDHPTLIAQGRGEREDAELYAALAGAAAEIPGARALYAPALAAFPPGFDVTAAILGSLGGAEFSDLRRPAPDRTGGIVVLFTGLSGSGKSTLAHALADALARHGTRPAVLLDGDDVRRALAGDLGFSAADRETNLLRQAWVAARVAQGGAVAICAPIAPFASTRARMRELIEPHARLVLVYADAPLHVAETRDRKGLYAKARAGLITDFTGIDSPYEPPQDADVVVNTAVSSVAEGVKDILDFLVTHRLL